MHRAVFPNICLLLIIFFFEALWLSMARAEGVRFNSDLLYTKSDTTTKLKATGESIDSDFERLDQRYNLNISRRFFPYLSFETGAIYEFNQLWSDTEGNEVDIDEEILRPFVGLKLDNPLYNAGLVVRKRRRKEKITDLPNTQADRDEFTGTVGMTPAELFPVWNLRYTHVHTYDDPETIDQIRETLLLDSSWRPWENLNLDYTYTRLDSEERSLDFDTLQQTHYGKIAYSQNFWDRRLSLNTAYTINYNKFEFSSETGFVDNPLLRSDGLSALDNTPEDGPALSSNDALIDGNLIANAGLDIGTAGDQTQLVNIGVDLGFPQAIDHIRIWVDRRLSAIVADSFSWAVYTSPDNTDLSTWSLVATVSPAIYATFENRFDIFFPTVNTRFIKVVTRPLSPTVPGAVDFTNIFVTEIQAFITQTETSDSPDTSVTDHNYTLNLRGRLSDRTIVNYNLLYSQQNSDPENDERTQLSNSAYLNHAFNNVFSANVNGQRGDTSVMDDDRTNYNYGASLKAAWLRTFDQSLTYTGRYEDGDLGTAYQNSIFLRSNSILYRGWSAFLDLGYTWEKILSGEQITSSVIRPGTSIQPHRTLDLNLNFQFRRNEQSGADIGPTDESKWDVQAFYTPFTTLSLFGKLNGLHRDGERDVFQQYTLNWSPFPDGDLQFFFTFNEVLMSENDRKQTVVGPGLQWRIGRHINLDMAYNWTDDDSDIQKIESNIFNSELKLIF